jgi:hypothetical protein
MNRRRSSKGQGLVEGACGTIIVTTVFVLLTAFAVNFYLTMVAHEKLRLVATECARVVDGKRYWLGMKRPDPQGKLAAAAKASATTLADALCAKLGLPTPRNIDLVEEDAGDGSITYTTCTVTCAGIRLPYGFDKIFPSILTITETGVAGDMAAEPYALLYVDMPLAGTDSAGAALGGRAALVLPIYGTASPQIDIHSGPRYRSPLKEGIEVGKIKGPFSAARLVIDPPGSVTQLSNEIAYYGADGEFLRPGSITATGAR